MPDEKVALTEQNVGTLEEPVNYDSISVLPDVVVLGFQEIDMSAQGLLLFRYLCLLFEQKNFCLIF
jgi:hypothetical protein